MGLDGCWPISKLRCPFPELPIPKSIFRPLSNPYVVLPYFTERRSLLQSLVHSKAVSNTPKPINDRFHQDAASLEKSVERFISFRPYIIQVVKTMPRKPLRCHKSLRHRPLSFSPFARSMAMIACAKKAKNKSLQIKLRNKDVQSASGNGKVELSDSSVDEEFQGVVQADFVFFDPKPGDFHGIKVLLQTYLDHKQWDLSGFVDLVLGQPTVGTVVKIENDDDDGIYSVVTVLSLERYKNNKCLIELKDYLLEVCQDKDVVASLKSLFGEHALGVGIIVSQRVVNLPSQLLPPLYDALFDEIAWATEDEPTEELRNSFRFKTYIVISKIYKHKNADQNAGKARNGDEVMIHIKPEDEIFLELSSWSFCFPLHAQQVTTSELKNYRLMGLAMVVDANKVSMFRKQLHSLIDESQYHESFQQSCQIQHSVVSRHCL